MGLSDQQFVTQIENSVKHLGSLLYERDKKIEHLENILSGYYDEVEDRISHDFETRRELTEALGGNPSIPPWSAQSIIERVNKMREAMRFQLDATTKEMEQKNTAQHHEKEMKERLRQVEERVIQLEQRLSERDKRVQGASLFPPSPSDGKTFIAGRELTLAIYDVVNEMNGYTYDDRKTRSNWREIVRTCYLNWMRAEDDVSGYFLRNKLVRLTSVLLAYIEWLDWRE